MPPYWLHLSHVRQEEELNLTAQMDGFHAIMINFKDALASCTWLKVSLDQGSRIKLFWGTRFKQHKTKPYLVNGPVTNNGIGGVEYLKRGVDELIRLIDEIVINNTGWTEEQQTRGGIAAWDCGLRQIGTHQTIDAFTVGQDFSSDIFARAQYFAENGY